MTAGRSVVQDVATTRRTAMQTDRSENDESRQPTATPKSDESANSTTENRGEATGRDHGLRGNATIGTVRGTAGGTRNRAAVGGSAAGIGRHGNLTPRRPNGKLERVVVVVLVVGVLLLVRRGRRRRTRC